MRYEMMFPDQIRKAIKESWPVVLPAGVLEYHAEHCVVGVDTLLIVKAVELLEKDMNIVVLPPFYYGAASYVVSVPENNGTVQVDADIIRSFAGELFKSMLRIGFRNIHVFVHHQSENFVAGMPTDLAFKFAARQIIFEFLDKKRGEGWWGKDSAQNYVTEHKAGTDPFNWIKVHPFIDEETQKKYPLNHAGLQETSLMMSFCPKGVDMSKWSGKQWFCKNANQASLEYGNKARKMILDKMRKTLSQ